MALTTVKVQLTRADGAFYESFTNIHLSAGHSTAELTIDDTKASEYIAFVHGICCAYPPIRLVDGNLPNELIEAYKNSFMINLSYIKDLADQIDKRAKPFLESQSVMDDPQIVDLSEPMIEEDVLILKSEASEESFDETEEMTFAFVNDLIEESDEPSTKKGRKKQS